MLDRRSRACVAAMAGIYHRLLERIAEEPQAVLRRRVSLPGWEKAYVAVSGLVGRRAS
jgi:phytoene synthase